MTTVSILRQIRAWRAPVAAAAVASGLAILAGCSAHDVSPVEATGSIPDDYRVNHPIAVEEGVQTLDVPVGIYGNQLTDAVKSNVAGFAQRFRSSGSSLIAVVAPSGSPNQNNAAAVAAQIEDLLRQQGVPAGAIDYRVYHAASDERNAPIRVAYSAIQAETAPCGPWTDQLAVNRENRVYNAFGCATQQNLAAMVDNPLDLLYPRGMTPADAQRRADVLNKYRNGQEYSSAPPQGLGSNIGEVGQ